MEFLKKISLILLLTNFCNLSAQEINGNAYYKLEQIRNILDSTSVKKKDEYYSSILSDLNNSIAKNKDNIEFKLTFNTQESLFEVIENLENDFDTSYEYALILSGAEKKYYYNVGTKEKIVQQTSYGKNFLVTHKNDINWKFESVSKTILGYKCYKASFKKEVRNNKGVFFKLVEAWYAPELTINIGPKGYVGLPGLILELKEGAIKYYCVKIELNSSKVIKVKKPTKGEVISKEALDSIGRSLYNENKKTSKAF